MRTGMSDITDIRRDMRTDVSDITDIRRDMRRGRYKDAYEDIYGHIDGEI